jgi:flagellar hook-associated protein 2
MTISNTSGTSNTSTSTTTSNTNTVTGGPTAIGYSNSQASSHVFGLVSGVDVDSMVSKMMTAASVPLVQMEQQRQILEWQQDDYRSMNSALLDLQTQTFNMSLQSSYLLRQANSSNTSLVTATASSTATKTSYTITNGTLATAANVKSSTNIQASGKMVDPTKSLWVNRDNFANNPFTYTKTQVTSEAVTMNSDGVTASLANKFIVNNDSSAPITVTATDSNGNSVTFNSSNIYYDQTSYNNDTTSVNKVLIDPNTGALTFNTTVSNVSASYSYGTITGNLTADIQTPNSSGTMQDNNFTFTADQSINGILNEINTSTAGVTAFYGNGNGLFSLTSNQAGNLYNSTQNNSKDIQLSGNLLNSTFDLQTANVTNGTDASLTINGAQVTSHTNTVTVNNVTFNINSNFQSTDSVNVNVSDDTSQILSNIENWVNKYNSTIATINSKISEKRDRSYQPLTSQQESQMSATQIQQWTDKAKSGQLSNDNILTSGLSQMRQDIYSPVTSSTNETYTQLSQIGITTSSNYLDNGKLEINEDQLKQAIANDPQSVMDLFTKTNSNYNQQGIMQRLKTTLTNTMNQVTQMAGNDQSVYSQYSLGLEINDYDTRISDEQTRLNNLQTRYYNQFTAMESAISSSNQQAAYIQSNMN